MKVKTPFTLVNAFRLPNLNDDFIQRLLQLHQIVYLLEEKRNTFLLPMISPATEMISPKFHVLPQEILEKLVKDNLELVVLLFLEEDGKSGYRILKDIASQFHCILSQGTLYPLLYRLEKEKKLLKQNGKGREVIYRLSEETEKQLEFRKKTCLKAYQHLGSFFKI
jgi:DNA-binding PadR family transcriptional regulator